MHRDRYHWYWGLKFFVLAPFLPGFVIRKFMRKCKWTFKWNYHSYAGSNYITGQKKRNWAMMYSMYCTQKRPSVFLAAWLSCSGSSHPTGQTNCQTDGKPRYTEWLAIKAVYYSNIFAITSKPIGLTLNYINGVFFLTHFGLMGGLQNEREEKKKWNWLAFGNGPEDWALTQAQSHIQ